MNCTSHTNKKQVVTEEMCLYLLKTHKSVPKECEKILKKLKYLGISGSKKEEIVQRAKIQRKNTYVINNTKKD